MQLGQIMKWICNSIFGAYCHENNKVVPRKLKILRWISCMQAQTLSQSQGRGRTSFQYSPVATVGTVPITVLCYTRLSLSILNCHSVVQQVQEKAATLNSVRWWRFFSITIDFDGLAHGKVVYQLWDSRITWLPRSEFPTKLDFSALGRTKGMLVVLN